MSTERNSIAALIQNANGNGLYRIMPDTHEFVELLFCWNSWLQDHGLFGSQGKSESGRHWLCYEMKTYMRFISSNRMSGAKCCIFSNMLSGLETSWPNQFRCQFA